MAEDDARFLGADGTAEDAIAAALVVLVVGPVGELLGTRRVAEPARTLAHDEPQHDAQRLAALGHRAVLSHASRADVKLGAGGWSA